MLNRIKRLFRRDRNVEPSRLIIDGVAHKRAVCVECGEDFGFYLPEYEEERICYSCAMCEYGGEPPETYDF